MSAGGDSETSVQVAVRYLIWAIVCVAICQAKTISDIHNISIMGDVYMHVCVISIG